MSYWLDMVKEVDAREAAEKLNARLVQDGADLRGVILIDKARADRLANRMAANRPAFSDDGGAA